MIWIGGGDGAPERARQHVLSRLDGDISRARAADAALIVSELVTNSVVHAGVDRDEGLFLELTTLGEQLRIAVIDGGSELEPALRPADPLTAGGYGLRLVEHLSSAWGVVRDAGGRTRVWCILPLDHAAVL